MLPDMHGCWALYPPVNQAPLASKIRCYDGLKAYCENAQVAEHSEGADDGTG